MRLMWKLTLQRAILPAVLLTALTSCTRSVNRSAEKAAPAGFASPSEAGAALLAAAQSNDRSALLAIFGPGGEEVLFTGNAAQDKANLRDFVNAYKKMNRWEEIQAGGKVLYIGADNSAFPIPLGRNSSGYWYFDTAAGKDEIRARRIGKNELNAIAACDAMADAQRQYFSQAHEGAAGRYAQKLLSDPGKQNGLYWPVADGHGPSPLSRFGGFAKAVVANGGAHPALFNGYYYRILAKPSDFAILAYPAVYRGSGIMTFVVGKDGAIYQKDLGEKTGEAALAMTDVNTADNWNPAMPATGTAARAQ